MLGYGNVAFFDLSFKWALIFSVIGITGVIMTFLPDKKLSLIHIFSPDRAHEQGLGKALPNKIYQRGKTADMRILAPW